MITVSFGMSTILLTYAITLVVVVVVVVFIVVVVMDVAVLVVAVGVVEKALALVVVVIVVAGNHCILTSEQLYPYYYRCDIECSAVWQELQSPTCSTTQYFIFYGLLILIMENVQSSGNLCSAILPIN